MRRRLLLSLAASAPLLLPALAAAHGLTPDAVDVFLRDAAPSEVVLATNFGVLVSHDAGVKWEWVCEDSFGSYAVNRYALGPDGTIFVASFDGLFVSAGGSACGFVAATGAITGYNIIDVAPDPKDASHVVALGTVATDGGSVSAGAFESVDGGKTFAPLPALPAGFQPLRARWAADGKTLYITAFVDDAGAVSPRLAVRQSGMGAFTIVDLTALAPDEITGIAIDPADATHVFLSTSGPKEDHVYESKMGGASPVERLKTPDQLRGLTLGDTAKQIFVGAKESQTLHRSDDGGMTWMKAGGGPHYRGLAVRGVTIWACGDWSPTPMGDGYALTRSPDKGASWGVALRFQDVTGSEAACLGGKCKPSAEWLCGFVCGGDDGGLGGGEPRPDTPRDGKDAAGDAPPAGDGGDGPGASGGGGCGCRFTSTSTVPALGVSLAMAALVGHRRRRQK